MVPNINKIAKECIADSITNVRKELSKLVLNTLGFDTTWHSVRLQSDSPLLNDIKELEEYRTLKANILNEIRVDMKDNPFTIKGKKELISEIRQRVQWAIRDEISNELVEEYSKQAIAILRNDPEIAPTIIASKMITANKPRKV